MAFYIITHQPKPERDYQALSRHLLRWKCVSPTKAVWIGQLLGPADDILDELRKFVDQEDKLLVIEIESDVQCAMANVADPAHGWLKSKICSKRR